MELQSPRIHSWNDEASLLGSRIAEIRRSRGYTQAQLAERIGISRLLLSDYERGKVRVYADVLARIASALDIPADQILSNPSTESSQSVPSLRLMRRLQKIERLPLAQQKALLKNIDMFLKAAESE